MTYNTTLVAMRKAGLSRQALKASESLVKPDAADPYTYCTLGVVTRCGEPGCGKKMQKEGRDVSLVGDFFF